MKSLNLLVLSSLMIGGLASANTIEYVHVVGAPAYRQTTNAVLAAVVATYASSGLTATSGPSSGASDVGGATFNQWYIPNFTSGNDLVVSSDLSGSTAGIEAVTSGVVTQNFIPDTDGTTAHVTSPLVAVSKTVSVEAHQPDFSLSDTFQNTTPFQGTVTEPGPTSSATFTHTYATITPTKIGVEPYQFYASPGAAAAGLTDITTAEAQLLFKAGALPLAYFTGKSSDENTPVYAVSRDPGSGARLGAVAETGVGVKSLIQTYEPTISGGGTVDTQGDTVSANITDDPGSVNLYLHGEIPSTTVYDSHDGDTGYASFGPLLTAITSYFTTTDGSTPNPSIGNSSATQPAYFVTYFNLSDGGEAATNGAQALTWNGVAYSAANLADGKYSFWAYEQYYPAATLAGDQSTFAGKVVAEYPTIEATASPATSLTVSALNVNRTVDGGPIGTKYLPNYP